MTAFLTRAPREDAQLRLFCFHHAGGGASFFSRWRDRVSPDVDVLPVQLPGRETRSRETPFHDVHRLADVLDRELDPWLDRPFALYGHSMGALTAYTLIRARARRQRRLPLALLLGASPAPHLDERLFAEDATDDQLARRLVDIGGLDPGFLGSADWLAHLLRTVRDDLHLCRAYGSLDPVRLPLGIHAFAGENDRLVRPAWIRAWAEHSREFDLTTLPGGHFFPREAPEPFFRALNRELAALLADAADDEEAAA